MGNDYQESAGDDSVYEAEAEVSVDEAVGNIHADPKIVKAGRVPTLRTFIRAINLYGIADKRTLEIAERLSYFAISDLRSHPDFNKFLDGIVLKALFSGREIENNERWILNFLSRKKNDMKTRPGVWGSTGGVDAAARGGLIEGKLESDSDFPSKLNRTIQVRPQ